MDPEFDEASLYDLNVFDASVKLIVENYDNFLELPSRMYKDLTHSTLCGLAAMNQSEGTYDFMSFRAMLLLTMDKSAIHCIEEENDLLAIACPAFSLWALQSKSQKILFEEIMSEFERKMEMRCDVVQRPVDYLAEPIENSTQQATNGSIDLLKGIFTTTLLLISNSFWA